MEAHSGNEISLKKGHLLTGTFQILSIGSPVTWLKNMKWRKGERKFRPNMFIGTPSYFYIISMDPKETQIFNRFGTSNKLLMLMSHLRLQRAILPTTIAPLCGAATGSSTTSSFCGLCLLATWELRTNSEEKPQCG